MNPHPAPQATRLALASIPLLAALAGGCGGPVVAPSRPVTPPIEVAAPRRTPSAAVAALGRPWSIRIEQTWSGLGSAHDLTARLDWSPEGYDTIAMLHVQPVAPESIAPAADRYDGKRLQIPAARVNAFVTALRAATFDAGEVRGMELPPIDDNGETDLFIFPSAGPALAIHRGPTNQLYVDLALRYRIRDTGDVERAYQALLAEFGIDAWVTRIEKEAFPHPPNPRP